MYTPDRFIILKYLEDNSYAILAGWSGGYLDGDSWRRSSRLKSAKPNEHGYEVTTESSTYQLRASSLGYTTLMVHILNQLSQLEEAADIIEVFDEPEQVEKIIRSLM